MGLLVDGTWTDRWYDTSSTGGRFVRKDATFRHAITAEGPFRPEAGRYHLYIAHACPWAHRTRVVRAVKGLDELIPISVVHPEMLEHGWVFDEAHPDRLHGLSRLYELYQRADPTFTGRVTVPVLWDTRRGTIVNNESSEIIRFLDQQFAGMGDPTAPLFDHKLWPEPLRDAIESINRPVYDHVNNGVYKCGFATTQQAYDEAVGALFQTLDMLERRLEDQPWLVGDVLTEADVRLFTTMLRFDLVYHVHFKCSHRRLVDYPELFDHTRAIFQIPRVADTVVVPEIRRHYFYSHDSINPHRIVPVAPDLDLSAPARRTAALPTGARR